jgi:hypothetical protein
MNDELGFDPEHPIPKPAKLLIPASVSPRRAFVDGAIDFDDQAKRRSQKVRDERPDHDLPPETHAEDAPGGKHLPESAFRERRKLAKRRRAGSKDESAMTRRREKMHGDSERAAWGRAQPRFARDP